MPFREADAGLVRAGDEPLQVYWEAILVLNLGGGLVVVRAFLMADLAADCHLLGMDFLSRYNVGMDLQAGQLEAAGHSYQMVHEGEVVTENRLTCSMM